MKQENAFSAYCAGAIERVREITAEFIEWNGPADVASRALSELKFHEDTLRRGFKFRKRHGPELGMADSDAYFSEKVVGMMSFAAMSIDQSQRGGYSADKIVENVDHYSYLVARMVVAAWTGRSRRPATDKAIRSASFEHSDALKRLVDR